MNPITTMSQQLLLLRWGVMLSAAMLLAGCGTTPHPAPPPPAPPPPPRVPVLATHPAVPKKPHPAPKPVVLVGLSEDEVAALLGAPIEKHDSGASQTWIYAARHCTLILTFFLDVTHNRYEALSRVVTGTDGSEAQAQHCIRRIRAHGKHP